MNENIFKRSDIYNLTNFILCGTDSADVYDIYQEDFEKKAYSDLMKKLEHCLENDTKKLEDILTSINTYTMMVSDLYFMNGMKVGARILEQLLRDN